MIGTICLLPTQLLGFMLTRSIHGHNTERISSIRQVRIHNNVVAMTLPPERIIHNSGLLRSRALEEFHSVEQHALPAHDAVAPASSSRLPCIDLHSARREQHLAAACRDWGFFQVRNHGVAPALLRQLRAHAHSFFQLPLQQKQLAAACRATDFYGYGVAKARTYFPDDWMEAFDMEWTPVARVRHHIARLNLPEAQHDDFCGVVEEFAAATQKLAVALTEMVAVGLDLDAAAFARQFADATTSTVRMNYYPPYPQPSRTLGISPHSDFNVFTILLHDSVPGLQVLKDGEWITVVPSSPNDTLVVNVGDTFQAWSNGRVRSVMHRALVNAVEPRLTVVHFFGPHPDTVIVPPAALVDESHPLQYRAFAYKEMVDQIVHVRGKKVFQSPLNSFLL